MQITRVGKDGKKDSRRRWRKGWKKMVRVEGERDQKKSYIYVRGVKSLKKFEFKGFKSMGNFHGLDWIEGKSTLSGRKGFLPYFNFLIK